MEKEYKLVILSCDTLRELSKNTYFLGPVFSLTRTGSKTLFFYGQIRFRENPYSLHIALLWL